MIHSSLRAIVLFLLFTHSLEVILSCWVAIHGDVGGEFLKVITLALVKCNLDIMCCCGIVCKDLHGHRQSCIVIEGLAVCM